MRERLSSIDEAWLRIDRPENTADVVALLAFDALPPAPLLREVLAARLLGATPRLRQRIERGWLGRDAWVDDEAFSLDRHLVRRALRAAGEEALQDVVGEIATEPLDPARPPWQLHVLEAPGGGGAIVAKIHHCVADGFALVGLMLALADGPPLFLAPRAGREPRRHVLPAARRLAPWLDPAGSLRAAWRDPRAAARLAAGGGAIAAALARLAALPADPPSALARPLTGRRRVAWSSGVPLARVRAAARAGGAHANDLLLAAVAGAVRAHLAAGGEDVDRLPLRAIVPVNLREGPPAPGEPLGNRFGLAFLDLAVAARDAPARLAATAAARARIAASADAIATYAALSAVGRAPAVEGAVGRFFSRKASLVITVVPGPRAPLDLAGSRVDRAMFWVPHPATLGLGVSVLSYGGEVRIGVRSDVGVVPDPAALVRRFEEELAALGVDPPREGAAGAARDARGR